MEIILAYVFENNLYVYSLLTEATKQITFDGVNNKIINGASDWVYEEEFSLVRSFDWSHDSKTIAYYKFDESDVKEFSMDIFKGGLYPTQEVFKYPKAGEDNSKVTLHLYDLKTNKITDINLGKNYEYIPRIKWFSLRDSTQKLIIFGMNGYQNELDVLTSQTDGSTRVFFSEKDKYYIDIHDNITFLKDHDAFIWTSEKDGFNHIYIKYLFDSNDVQITKGNWEITKFYGIDENNIIFLI